MNNLKYIIVNLVETLLRVIPFPCKTGLIKINNPDRHSPVFLTCNYHLTVERVKRALRGIDCYLLVANSRGHNVWCGSVGGHFTNHSIISVLKTSGIEELVDHRKVILPQLAATGIESKVIQNKTGWNTTWGPVYAKDIPIFIKNRFIKTPEMREVRFPLEQRIEMAAMWACPFSIVVAPLILFLCQKLLMPLIIFIWVFSGAIFLGFPLYSKWLNSKKKGLSFSKYTIIFDFSRMPLCLWGIVILFLLLYSVASSTFTIEFISRWSFISFIIILIFSIDLMGSTPLYKSGLHEDRFLRIFVDKDKCRGAGFCEQVCPRNCYQIDRVQHIATLIRDSCCVQCGACIVQCPCDALYFRSPTGETIPPEAIRRFKLNLIGKRLIEVVERR